MHKIWNKINFVLLGTGTSKFSAMTHLLQETLSGRSQQISVHIAEIKSQGITSVKEVSTVDEFLEQAKLLLDPDLVAACTW